MNRRYSCDVAVIGGGPAGIAAAVGAAQAGAKTLLIERGPCLGGQATQSNVVAFCGFHSRGSQPLQVVAGVGQRVLELLEEVGEDVFCWVSPTTGNASIRFHPERLKLALDLLTLEAGIDLRLHAVLTDAQVRDGGIEMIECADDAGKFAVEAGAYVDATGDANLAFLAGCETMWGDENGVVQQAGLVVRMDRLPADAVTTPPELAKAIAAAKAAGAGHMPKENGFMIRIDGADTGYLTTPSWSIQSLDSESLTKAEMAMRRQAHAYVQALREYLPGMHGARMVSTGPQLGLRESRRVVGQQLLTGQDVLQLRARDDAVARGGWSPETHRDDSVSYTHLSDHAWFDIPIGALKARLQNLWCAGRNISCESVAQASIRVMGTAFATGHGAGVAAALTGGRAAYDYPAIRAELIRQGAIL